MGGGGAECVGNYMDVGELTPKELKVVEDTEEAGKGEGEAGAHQVGIFGMLLKLRGVRLNLVPLVGVGGKGVNDGGWGRGGWGGGCCSQMLWVGLYGSCEHTKG